MAKPSGKGRGKSGYEGDERPGASKAVPLNHFNIL